MLIPSLEIEMNIRRCARASTIAILVTVPLAAEAQVCTGAASFSAGPVQIAAGVGISDGTKSYGARLGAGAATGVFASAGIVRSEYDDVSGAGIGLELEGGYAIDLTPAKSIQFCPLASFDYQSGPDVESTAGTITTSAHAVGLGGSLGGVVPMAPTFDFVPFAGAQYVISRVSVSVPGFSSTESAGYTAVDLGAGFVVNRTLTLQPSVSIPVGLDGGKATFQIAFAFNVGPSSARQ